MKMVFQQKVQEKESKLKQSEEELYARHREMKEALEKQKLELEDKKRRLESGRPLTPEKSVRPCRDLICTRCSRLLSAGQEEGLPPYLIHLCAVPGDTPLLFFFYLIRSFLSVFFGPYSVVMPGVIYMLLLLRYPSWSALLVRR